LTRSLPLTRSNELPVDVARVSAAPFCETPASDTDALQFGSPITSLAAVLALAKAAALAEAWVCRGPWHELI